MIIRRNDTHVQILYNFTKIPKQVLWSLKGLINKKIPGGSLKQYHYLKVAKAGPLSLHVLDT